MKPLNQMLEEWLERVQRLKERPPKPGGLPAAYFLGQETLLLRLMVELRNRGDKDE